MDSSLPVFIDLPEKDQAQEIRQYLISAGSDLSRDGKENIHEELSCLLDACDNWLKSASDADLEAMMNSFISLILFCAFDEKLTKKFCTKLTEIGASENNALLRIRILNNLFVGLPEVNPLRYDVYLSQLHLASKFGHTNAIITQLKQVQDWLKLWDVNIEQKRSCYRELHAALKDQQKGDQATRVMLELLSTYDEESASQAKDDAQKCILDFISKPDIFIIDHLLSLKPVAVLKGQPIHQLLEIFVSGDLSNYHEFYKNNTSFIDNSVLVHEDNVQKMRILTMLTLAKQHQEINFITMQERLGLNEDDIEEFVIDLVKSKLVHAKIDQLNKKIIIRSTSCRTFGLTEWKELQGKLDNWLNNLQTIRSSLEQTVNIGA